MSDTSWVPDDHPDDDPTPMPALDHPDDDPTPLISPSDADAVIAAAPTVIAAAAPAVIAAAPAVIAAAKSDVGVMSDMMQSGMSHNDPVTVRRLVVSVAVITVMVIVAVVVLAILGKGTEALIVGLLGLASGGMGGLVGQMTTRVPSSPSQSS